MRSLISAIVLGSTLLGCEAVRGGANPEVPVWVHRPSWAMEVGYSRNLVAESRRHGEAYERGSLALDVSHRRVFVGSSDGGLYALRATDGQTLWRFETLGPVQCEPLYDPSENVVYFGSNDGALYKVDAHNGRLHWRFATNAEVAKRPTLTSDGKLYAVNANDTVVALNAKTGARIWSQHRPPALGMEVAGYSGATVFRDKVYLAFSDGTVTAYDRHTGAEVWQPIDLSAEAEQRLGDIPKYLDVDTTPEPGTIGETPVVYVGSYEGGVFALDAETGSIVSSNPDVLGVVELTIWKEPAHQPKDPSLPPEPARELLLASTGTTGLWALDPQDLQQDLWRRDLPDGGVSRPVPMMGALLVATTTQGLFLMSPQDGGVIDGLHTGGGFSSVPVAFGRRAFALSNHGRFLSIHVSPPGGAQAL